MAKCRIGTAKFFTFLLLLYRTSVKGKGLKQIEKAAKKTGKRPDCSWSWKTARILPVPTRLSGNSEKLMTGPRRKEKCFCRQQRKTVRFIPFCRIRISGSSTEAFLGKFIH
ncbi:hypothetical protein B5E64_06655 [Drancourtella sp. An12]|nr:hypothetical protein B5E64_06655 [Drancourtella sp. An12]